MKGIFKKSLFLFVFLAAQASYAALQPTGMFSPALLAQTIGGGGGVVISSQSYAYPSVGVKIVSPHHSINIDESDCSLASTGYCIFPVAPGDERIIKFKGTTGPVKVRLCLNGLGPLTCAEQTWEVRHTSTALVRLNKASPSLGPLYL